MHDILIRGMEMPESCADCPICYDTMECSVSPLRFWNGRTELEQFEFCNERHTSCPLVELPPHGDLISRERAFHMMLDRGYQKEAAGVILEVPTVIPASEEATDDPQT